MAPRICLALSPVGATRISSRVPTGRIVGCSHFKEVVSVGFKERVGETVFLRLLRILAQFGRGCGAYFCGGLGAPVYVPLRETGSCYYGRGSQCRVYRWGVLPGLVIGPQWDVLREVAYVPGQMRYTVLKGHLAGKLVEDKMRVS